MGNYTRDLIMAYREYVNINTGESFFCFEDDENRLPDVGDKLWRDIYVKMPPTPVVVHSTNEFMTEDPVLDSLTTIYELDRQLNIEAENERDLKALEQARINF